MERAREREREREREDVVEVGVRVCGKLRAIVKDCLDRIIALCVFE
jgi:hypothetical protein